MDLKHHLHEIIFESETPRGKFFDIILMGVIIISVLTVVLESVSSIEQKYGSFLHMLEWILTGIFTVEYILRLYAVKKPLKYAVSFFGIIDLLAVLPTYLALFFTGAHYLMVIRTLRILRIFRILKLAVYVSSANVLMRALHNSRYKITIFLFGIVNLVVILGAVMYLVEGEENGFTSIPRSIYWAVVTLTTVGYGDIAPKTPVGQFLSSIIMILGYGIIAVPTGIVSAEIARSDAQETIIQEACPACGRDGHDYDATHCKFCGAKLYE